MTSKEAFKKICKNLNSYEFTDEFKKYKKQIVKDLEILKYLKERLEVRKGGTWYYLDVKYCWFESEDEIEKLKTASVLGTRVTEVIMIKIWLIKDVVENMLFDIEETEPKNWLRYRGCLEKVLKQLADIEDWFTKVEVEEDSK